MSSTATGPREILTLFPNARAARLYLEERRWHGEPSCPFCEADQRITARSGRRIGYYRCHACAGEFTVRTGTIFERSHVPLQKWVYAMHLLMTARKSVSSIQLAKEIGVTQKTAWGMLGRLREAAQVERMKTPDTLDAMAEKVLQHTPARKPLRVIAGTPDRPLLIGEIEIPCYVLEDETRVLSQRGFLSAIGRSESRSGHSRASGDKLPGFLAASNLKPFIDGDLAAATNPVEFQLPHGGPVAHGYPAIVLPQVCEVYLKAREAGALLRSQRHVATRAAILIRGLATVGIIALVDEATGYQRVRAERALATILERFIAEELQPWSKTFDYEFYEEIFRLKGWDGPHGNKRSPLIGRYTNDFVYARIAPGVLDELRERNPVLPQGWRKNRHHQWFTPNIGHPKLKEHLAGVTALMRAAATWESFKRSLDRAYPKVNTTLVMPIGDD